MPETDREEPRHFRNDTAMLVQVTCSAGLGLAGVGMLLTPSAELGVRLTGLLLALLGFVLSKRLFHYGVTAEDGGIVLHGVLSTRRVEWGRIERFEVAPGTNLVQPTSCVLLVFDDGKRQRVESVSAFAPPGRHSAVHDVVAELNRRLETAR